MTFMKQFLQYRSPFLNLNLCEDDEMSYLLSFEFGKHHLVFANKKSERLDKRRPTANLWNSSRDVSEEAWFP